MSLGVARDHPCLASRGIDIEQQLAMFGGGIHRRRVVRTAAAGDDAGIEDTEVHMNVARRLGTAEHLVPRGPSATALVCVRAACSRGRGVGWWGPGAWTSSTRVAANDGLFHAAADRFSASISAPALPRSPGRLHLPSAHRHRIDAREDAPQVEALLAGLELSVLADEEDPRIGSTEVALVQVWRERIASSPG